MQVKGAKRSAEHNIVDIYILTDGCLLQTEEDREDMDADGVPDVEAKYSQIEHKSES